jgi:DNA-binding transcriptional MerR regulator
MRDSELRTTMSERPRTYSMTELRDMTGIRPRNIRYYISEGLLSPAHGRGPSATYDEGHLARLRLIQLLKSQHVPLAEIRERLADLTDRQVLRLVTDDSQQTGERWRRVTLHPDIELQVRERDSSDPGDLDDAIALILDLVRPVIDRLGAPHR